MVQNCAASVTQRNLKFWADVADKMCFGRTYVEKKSTLDAL